ncbi:MAG: ABC transporter permease, partial [Terriglobales bacterium]
TATLGPAPGQSGAHGAAVQGPAPTNARGAAALRPAPTQSRGAAALGIAPTFALAAGALAGALRRSSVLTAALATAIGVMLGVAIMVGSFRQTVALWLGQQLQATVFVRPADWDRNHPVPIAPALAARLLATPAAGAIEADHLQRWLFRGQPVLIDTHWAAAGVGAPPQQRFLAGGPGPVIVSEPFARRFHLWAGDPIPLTGPRGALNARIAGVFYDYTSSQGEIVLAPASFRQAFGAPAITELGFDPAPGVAATALEAAINGRLLGRTGMVVTNNQQLRTAAMRVFDQTFQITYALEVITLLVAVLGVANTLLAVVLERGKELAILRALGAVRRQLRHLLLAEAALIATLALALGWGVGITLAWILVRVINVQSFGWTILWHWPWLYLVLASALVWLATLAAGWVPARTAERTIAPALLESE